MSSVPSVESLQQQIAALDQQMIQVNQFYQEILNHIPHGIFVKDSAHCYVLVNDAYCNATGFQHDDLLEKSDDTLFPQAQADLFRDREHQVFENHRTTVHTECYTDAKGNQRTRLTRRTALSSSGGGQLLFGVTQDLNTSGQSAASLWHGQDQYHAAMLHSGITFAQTDGELRYTWIFNPHSDFKSKHMIGKLDIEIADNAGTRQLMQLKQHALDSGKQQRMDIDFPLSNGLRTYDVIAAPLKDNTHTAVGVTTSAQDITRRRRVEADLQRSEAKYRDLFNLAQEGIWVIDGNGYTTLVNPSMATMLGYTPDEMQGRHLFDFMDATHVATARTKLERRRCGIREQHDFEFVHRAGHPVFTTLETAPILDSDGNYNGAIAGVMDITARKRAEAALFESEARLNAFLKHSPVGCGIWDRSFRYLFLNAMLQKINGPSMEDHIGHNITEVLPKAADIVVPLFDQILATGQPLLNLELSGEVPARPGEITHYLVSYFPITAADKEIQYIGGVIVDITEQQRAKEALQQSEARYRSLVEFSSEHIFMLDREGRFITSNRPSEFFSLEKERTLEGRCLTEIYPPDTAANYLNQLQQVLATGKAVDFEHTIQKEAQTCHGLDTLYPILDNGDIVSVGGISRDITQLKQIEHQLHQARKMESIGTLAGGVAHDFNNLLFMITGNADLALEEIPDWNPVHEYLKEIRDASLRAAGVVKQLLHFSRSSHLNLRTIRAIPAIKAALELIQSILPPSIGLRSDLLVADISMVGDPVQLNQVMLNICTNAVQAMQATGGWIEIEVDQVWLGKNAVIGEPKLAPGAYLRIRVRDTGPGIDPKIIEQIFEPYFTTREVGQGSGLGLAVVHGIVKHHGGIIMTSSQLGHGAAFSMLFPVVSDKRAPQEIPSVVNGGKRVSILLVADNPTAAKLISAMLSPLDYRVDTQGSPVAALERFRSHPDQFDLVVTATAMSQMTGVTLMQRVRQIRRHIPVIFCSGPSDRIDAENAFALGVNAYLVTPFEPDELTRSIQTVLNREPTRPNF